MARLAEYVPRGYSLLFSYCIGFNMLHSKLKTPRRFILLLVRCVKLKYNNVVITTPTFRSKEDL